MGWRQSSPPREPFQSPPLRCPASKMGKILRPRPFPLKRYTVSRLEGEGHVVGWLEAEKKIESCCLTSRKRGCGDHTKLTVKRNLATTHQLRLGSVSPFIYKGFSTIPGCLGFLPSTVYIELSTWIWLGLAKDSRWMVSEILSKLQWFHPGFVNVWVVFYPVYHGICGNCAFLLWKSKHLQWKSKSRATLRILSSMCGFPPCALARSDVSFQIHSSMIRLAAVELPWNITAACRKG